MKKLMMVATALFIACAIMLSGGLAQASAEKTVKADEKQQPADCDAQRYIKLNALEYTSPEKWELWINDHQITSAGVAKSEGFPKELVEVLVIDANNVKIRWYDKCLDKVVGHTFNPGQTYWIVPGLIAPGTSEVSVTEIPLPQVAADTPLEQAGITDVALILWAEIAASDVMTFSFRDYEEKFTHVQKKYFTTQGFNKFYSFLQASGLMKSVTDYQQTITSFSRSAQEIQRLKNSCISKRSIERALAQNGSIIESEVREGHFVVKINVPLIMTVCAGSKKITKGYNVILTIQRVPSAENANGLAIIDWQPLENNPSKKDEKP